MERRRDVIDPPAKSVRPTPVSNRVSPENNVPDDSSYRQIPPSVCPGVQIVLNLLSPRSMTSPSESPVTSTGAMRPPKAEASV